MNNHWQNSGHLDPASVYQDQCEAAYQAEDQLNDVGYVADLTRPMTEDELKYTVRVRPSDVNIVLRRDAWQRSQPAKSSLHTDGVPAFPPPL